VPSLGAAERRSVGWAVQGPLEAPLEQQAAYYEAMQAFAHTVNAADMVAETRLRPGDLVVFNNRRVLHGRTRFDPATGERHLRGSYIDLDAFRDRWRVLTERRYLGTL
jgi:gamma-butyrobetaine dioxygenase